MILRVAGGEVEISGESAEEVRSVAESITQFLLERESINTTAYNGTSRRAQEGERVEAVQPGNPSQHNPTTTIFISHSSHDVRFVENELIPFLKENGLEPWYSKDDIRTADHWERQIVAALNHCEWFLIVLSPKAALSEWVKDELHWAINHREGRIIPVLIEKCDPHDFHIRLSRIEFVDYRADVKRGRKRILEAVHRGVVENTGDPSPEVSLKSWWEFWRRKHGSGSD